MPRIIKRGPQCKPRFTKNDALRKKISRSNETLETKQAKINTKFSKLLQVIILCVIRIEIEYPL